MTLGWSIPHDIRRSEAGTATTSANMIAACEVVDRPMGIVKEWVENCIDASASHVEIQILQGGIDTITIIDDGIGMDAEDATLALSLIHI